MYSIIIINSQDKQTWLEGKPLNVDVPQGNPLLFFKQGLNYHSVPYSNSKELRCSIIIQLIADDFPVSYLPVLRKEVLCSLITVSEHPCVWRHATISPTVAIAQTLHIAVITLMCSWQLIPSCNIHALVTFYSTTSTLTSPKANTMLTPGFWLPILGDIEFRGRKKIEQAWSVLFSFHLFMVPLGFYLENN